MRCQGAAEAAGGERGADEDAGGGEGVGEERAAEEGGCGGEAGEHGAQAGPREASVPGQGSREGSSLTTLKGLNPKPETCEGSSLTRRSYKATGEGRISLGCRLNGAGMKNLEVYDRVSSLYRAYFVISNGEMHFILGFIFVEIFLFVGMIALID